MWKKCKHASMWHLSLLEFKRNKVFTMWERVSECVCEREREREREREFVCEKKKGTTLYRMTLHILMEAIIIFSFQSIPCKYKQTQSLACFTHTHTNTHTKQKSLIWKNNQFLFTLFCSFWQKEIRLNVLCE